MTDVAVVELHPALDESGARELIDTIKRTVQIVESQIVRAYYGRAWEALGYSTWDEMCEAEFDGARIRLPREERTMVVGSLRDAGLSTRAIAAATGVSQPTVVRDLTGDSNESPADPDAEVIDAEVIDAGEIAHEPARTTGIDGKSYPASKAPTNQRVESIRSLAKLGLTTDEIADQIGITASRISNIAKSNKIRLPGNSIDVEAKIIQAREMAAAGHTSAQIGAAIGVENMANWRKRHGVEVPADAAVGAVRAIDSRRVVEQAVLAADGVGLLLDQVDYSEIDPIDVNGWVASLNESIRSLTTLRNRLKELTQP